MAEQKIARRGRGRPTKLDPPTSARVAALLIRGDSISETAREVGISRRTLTDWLGRAWSRDPRDRAQVELVRTIVRGRDAYAEIGRRATMVGGSMRDVQLRSLAELYRDLDDA